ncbi:Hypothetical predicted protein [Cloeon dipterum]|uniref:STING ligand-binding domain-containing protein n=1 Tax=Cloeon dipterum TaxID=197152 RepID=A0A8S1D8T9_9INSE|nr:Hypothetical predicted protein [Cloeon dipterum]
MYNVLELRVSFSEAGLLDRLRLNIEMGFLSKLAGGIAAGAAGFYLNDCLNDDWQNLAIVPVGILIGEFASRITLFVKSKSGNSSLKENHAFLEFFTQIEKHASLTAFAYLVATWNQSGPQVLVVALASFLVRRALLKPPPIAVKQLYGRELNGIYYGPGMAYSYFYGYLNILLPPSDGKTYLDRIDAYIDKNVSSSGNRIRFPDRRLQILIPLSGDLTGNTNLVDHSNDWLNKSKEPFSVEIDRGGITNRKYHNSVCYIKDPETAGKPVYTVAEFATPIITYMEACRLSGETDLFSYKRETVLNFYDTLKRLISNDSSINECVNLILYDGLDEKGEPVNVAKVLLENVMKGSD